MKLHHENLNPLISHSALTTSVLFIIARAALARLGKEERFRLQQDCEEMLVREDVVNLPLFQVLPVALDSAEMAEMRLSVLDQMKKLFALASP
jgi:hypothetical protein